MGLYVSGLTEAELESYCDIAQSTKKNYDNLKEQLIGLQDNLNSLKKNATFNQGDDEGVTSDVMFIDFLMKNINTCVVFFFFFGSSNTFLE